MSEHDAKLFGGIEAGGTKFVCAVGYAPGEILAETRFPTTTPQETIHRSVQFFRTQIDQHGSLMALGVASFGPLDLQPNSLTYGHILATPKVGWSHFNLLGAIQAGLNLPTGIDTDVNGAALAEQRWGAARGLDSCVYLTVGTGIGGGAVVNGRLLHGLTHPEMGHLFIPHDQEVDPFPGVCPFHGDCLEGLATGPAMAARWGQNAETLPPDHPAWRLEAHYLAAGIGNIMLTLSPERVILGGGVMQQTHLFLLVRQELHTWLNGYIHVPIILEHLADFVVPPALDKYSGVLGAIALAQDQVNAS
jgi:fructokinase